MFLNPLSLIHRGLNALVSHVKQRLRRWTKPDNQSLALSAVLDLTRSKSELVLENALLRQQLIVLQRHAKRPTLSWRDRALFVFIASNLPTWKTALMIIQPDTLLRWHRDLFRFVWRRKSKRKGKVGRAPLAEDTIRLIKTMAKANQTWGAERIRGELLKLGIKVAKSTIQRYIHEIRGPLATKQTWSTFLRNHAKDIWAVDFLQTCDLSWPKTLIRQGPQPSSMTTTFGLSRKSQKRLTFLAVASLSWYNPAHYLLPMKGYQCFSAHRPSSADP